MLTYAAIPLTCWLCALLALPRRPLPGNEVEELVYARLLGRHQRVVLLALIVSATTVFSLVVQMPSRAHPAAITAQETPRATCESTAAGPEVCYVGRAGSMSAVMRQQADGTVVIEDYVPSPPSLSQLDQAVIP